jgi:hypothetical protein
MVRVHWFDTIMTDYNGNLPSIDTIKQQILSIEDDLTRIFCILSYLTGGRISEIVNYEQEKHIRVAHRNKKKEVVKDDEGNTIYDKIERKNKEIIRYAGLLRKNVVKELVTVKDSFGKERTIEAVKIVMRNEKNKITKYKTLYAPYYFEKELIDNLYTYLDILKEDEVIVNISRRSMYNYFRKYAKSLYYPHFIRALRVGVLIEVYEFSNIDIQRMMGWTNMMPLNSYYIFKKDKSILNTFIRKIEEAKV